jgi:uncharacterized protein (DUF1800 family)
MELRTAQALVRFGLGRRGDEPLPTDPVSWLLAQLRQPDPTSIEPRPNAADGLIARREDGQIAKREAVEIGAMKAPREPRHMAPLFYAQAKAELTNAVTTQAPYRERLVWFWTNHFTVSRRVATSSVLVAALVEEAIRPHVTGKFADMLLAVMQHPAMLIYLTNSVSIGPDSPAGIRTHLGLNENLARECMELYTITPRAGYSQADVIAFAKLLTGWSVDMSAPRPGFRFFPRLHEPGVQTVMGHSFPPTEDGGIAALRFFAEHPSTHRFLATKLVRHFVADTPPADAVRQIEGVLRDTRGDLRAASEALVSLDAAWQPGTKLRTPQDYVIASVRLLDLPPDQLPNLVGILAALGQPLWDAVQPNGWSDLAADWVAPEAMMRRIDWANNFAGRIGTRDAIDLAQANLGPLLRPETLEAMRHAGSRRDALTLLMTSSEFQRR